MQSRRKPIYKWGSRNYHCPDYEKCFSDAFRFHWKFWTCSRCPCDVKKIDDFIKIGVPKMPAGEAIAYSAVG